MLCHDSIAAEAVLLIPITSMAPSTMPMTSAVSSSASRVECAIMIKAALADEEKGE